MNIKYLILKIGRYEVCIYEDFLIINHKHHAIYCYSSGKIVLNGKKVADFAA